MAQYVYDAKILANLVAQAQKAYDTRKSANRWHNQQVDKEREEKLSPVLNKYGIDGVSFLKDMSESLTIELQNLELKYHSIDRHYLIPDYKNFLFNVKRPDFVLKSVKEVILTQNEHDNLNYCLNL